MSTTIGVSRCRLERIFPLAAQAREIFLRFGLERTSERPDMPPGREKRRGARLIDGRGCP